MTIEHDTVSIKQEVISSEHFLYMASGILKPSPSPVCCPGGLPGTSSHQLLLRPLMETGNRGVLSLLKSTTNSLVLVMLSCRRFSSHHSTILPSVFSLLVPADTAEETLCVVSEGVEGEKNRPLWAVCFLTALLFSQSSFYLTLNHLQNPKNTKNDNICYAETEIRHTG